MAEKKMSRKELLKIIEEAARDGREALSLYDKGITELPDEIGQLSELRTFDLRGNQLTKLPETIGQLANVTKLVLYSNSLKALPETIGQLNNLQELDLGVNQLRTLPKSIDQLTNLVKLRISENQLIALPKSIGQLDNLKELLLHEAGLKSLDEWIGQLTNLTGLWLGNNQLSSLPNSIGQLHKLDRLHLHSNQLTSLPESIGQLANLDSLTLEDNQLTSLPTSLARLEKLTRLNLAKNPLNPALKSAYKAGLPELRAYLRSLEDEEAAEPLYEAKLVLVGEGDVGKTTLLRAMTGQEPREDEPTTHGVKIDIQSMRLPHPNKPGVEIQLNAWDFGGQEVYRVTHQFFFSRRSVYLLVWEPRRGVQQCQVEDWLKIIRLRVGDDARVIIVSTYCQTGEHIARIDKPVYREKYGSMIAGFCEVDSLVDDPKHPGEKVGVKALRDLIAETAKDLEQMGMAFNNDWKAARDELLKMEQPRISYDEFGEVCGRHNLDAISARTLVGLMHDLGYIVYYGKDEHLKDDVVLQPQWLTKAIGFVLEDRTTAEEAGILQDRRLKDVWLNHPFKDEPRYEPELYPFFLRLMEKYDVSYRLEEGHASLVAQHVPQVRPALPWLPEEATQPGLRRLAMVCVMDDEPPGLVPWMIVRTQDYAYDRSAADRHSAATGQRLHWQKGMFLRNKSHGEALLELRGREFHVYAEAVWPEYFINILRRILHKLITDNWPGLEDRYAFTVPCPEAPNGIVCDGRFDIDALRQFLEEGDETIRCQDCRTNQQIVKLLYGFEVEEEDSRRQLSRIAGNIEVIQAAAPQWTVGQPLAEEQLLRIESKLDGLSLDQRRMGGNLKLGIDGVMQELRELESRISNYVMAIMQAIASESKAGPRLFTIEPVDGNWRRWVAKRYRLHLWCEAEGCQHPVLEDAQGEYEFDATREWVGRVAPYANFIAGVLKTVLPVAAPAMNVLFGEGTVAALGIQDHLDFMKEATGALLQGDLDSFDPSPLRQGLLSEAERSGVLALHTLLGELDPNQQRLGLRRIPTYTGDYLWLCETHYEMAQSKIPDKIE